jgi:CRISPR-associated protein Cas1
MQPKGGPRLLVTDREGALYLERARIHVDGSRIVYHITDDDNRREYNVPHVNLAVLFMGQGTSITQDAMRLLGEEGVHLAVTGTGGTPLHMGSLTTYSGTAHFRAILPIYLDQQKSLLAARSVMKDRTERMRRIGANGAKRHLRHRDVGDLVRISNDFDTKLSECINNQQLLGFEGNFSKQCYALFARMSGVNKGGDFRRMTGGSDLDNYPTTSDQVKLINRLIDHGNYLCYGMAGAALWALGIPPHMSIFHGKTRAGGLVFDLADAFKDSLVLPLAFASILLSKDENPEKVFRARLINAFDDHKVLSEAIGTVDRLLVAGSAEIKPDA